MKSKRYEIDRCVSTLPRGARETILGFDDFIERMYGDALDWSADHAPSNDEVRTMIENTLDNGVATG